ncbi:MAG: hypothetical protein L3K15_01535 [Thermoplasmata archaeon]|nr:hypothetical protein [Thermoplasmata archaeon]
MSTSRAVRITRTPMAEAAAASSAAPRIVPFVPNRTGTQRGTRLFLVFVVLALAVYAAFVALAASSPTAGVRTDSAVYGALTVLALVIAGIGFLVTLGRAPRAAAWRDDRLVVRERTGGLRRFRRDGLRVAVVYRYVPGFLSTEPAELVTVSDADGRHRNYLVGRGFFEPVAAPD